MRPVSARCEHHRRSRGLLSLTKGQNSVLQFAVLRRSAPRLFRVRNGRFKRHVEQSLVK